MEFQVGQEVYFLWMDDSIVLKGKILQFEPNYSGENGAIVEWESHVCPNHLNECNFKISNLYATFKEAHLALKGDILEQINDVIMGDLKRLYARLETCEQQAFTGIEEK